MHKSKIQQMEKERIAQVRKGDICNGAVIGIFMLWGVWIATSLLIHFLR